MAFFLNLFKSVVGQGQIVDPTIYTCLPTTGNNGVPPGSVVDQDMTDIDSNGNYTIDAGETKCYPLTTAQPFECEGNYGPNVSFTTKKCPCMKSAGIPISHRAKCMSTYKQDKLINCMTGSDANCHPGLKQPGYTKIYNKANQYATRYLVSNNKDPTSTNINNWLVNSGFDKTFTYTTKDKDGSNITKTNVTPKQIYNHEVGLVCDPISNTQKTYNYDYCKKWARENPDLIEYNDLNYCVSDFDNRYNTDFCQKFKGIQSSVSDVNKDKIEEFKLKELDYYTKLAAASSDVFNNEDFINTSMDYTHQSYKLREGYAKLWLGYYKSRATDETLYTDSRFISMSTDDDYLKDLDVIRHEYDNIWYQHCSKGDNINKEYCNCYKTINEIEKAGYNTQKAGLVQPECLSVKCRNKTNIVYQPSSIRDSLKKSSCPDVCSQVIEVTSGNVGIVENVGFTQSCFNSSDPLVKNKFKDNIALDLGESMSYYKVGCIYVGDNNSMSSYVTPNTIVKDKELLKDKYSTYDDMTLRLKNFQYLDGIPIPKKTIEELQESIKSIIKNKANPILDSLNNDIKWNDENTTDESNIAKYKDLIKRFSDEINPLISLISTLETQWVLCREIIKEYQGKRDVLLNEIGVAVNKFLQENTDYKQTYFDSYTSYIISTPYVSLTEITSIKDKVITKINDITTEKLAVKSLQEITDKITVVKNKITTLLTDDKLQSFQSKWAEIQRDNTSMTTETFNKYDNFLNELIAFNVTPVKPTQPTQPTPKSSEPVVTESNYLIYIIGIVVALLIIGLFILLRK